jgi:hypothetical protein
LIIDEGGLAGSASAPKVEKRKSLFTFETPPYDY